MNEMRAACKWEGDEMGMVIWGQAAHKYTSQTASLAVGGNGRLSTGTPQHYIRDTGNIARNIFWFTFQTLSHTYLFFYIKWLVYFWIKKGKKELRDVGGESKRHFPTFQQCLAMTRRTHFGGCWHEKCGCQRSRRLKILATILRAVLWHCRTCNHLFPLTRQAATALALLLLPL